MTSVRLRAPAKINWALEVLRRRDDGYHEVVTVLQTIDLCDEVLLEPADVLSLAVQGRHEAAEDDLALRAARLLAGEAGRESAVAIHLAKRIPAAAGLGGGSSDAAAVLRGLNRLWGLSLAPQRLAGIAAGIGSDVPFFVYGGTALGEGRGERITPLAEAPETWLVLLVPPLRLPEKTARMYGALSPTEFSDGSRTEAFVERLRRGVPTADRGLFNVFERAAFELFPTLAAYRDALLAAGGSRIHLAGSGPALFALGPSQGEARRIFERLRPADGQAFLARTLTAGEATTVEG